MQTQETTAVWKTVTAQTNLVTRMEKSFESKINAAREQVSIFVSEKMMANAILLSFSTNRYDF